MKKVFLAAAVSAMALAACQQPSGYTIKGTAEGVADGELVYLQNLVDGNLEVLDSAVVKNGQFEFKCPADSVLSVRYVTYESNDGSGGMRAPFFTEDGVITLNMNAQESRVAGTVHNDIYQKFYDEYALLDTELETIWKRIQSDATLSAAQVDSLKQVLNEKEKQGVEQVFQTISENIENGVGVHLLTSFSYAFEPTRVQPLLAKIPAAYDANPAVASLKLYIETAAKTAVGQPFIDFSMNTPEGKSVSLSDFISKNNYTLVDFWASWCGPCRMEMPNVVKAYGKYKAKGLGIVGVSLDNNQESWTKAIKDLKMDWNHMSDLKGWKSEGAALYGVRSIPAIVLIDKEGKIIARNLRGEELEAKLSELLK